MRLLEDLTGEFKKKEKTDQVGQMVPGWLEGCHDESNKVLLGVNKEYYSSVLRRRTERRRRYWVGGFCRRERPRLRNERLLGVRSMRSRL